MIKTDIDFTGNYIPPKEATLRKALVAKKVITPRKLASMSTAEFETFLKKNYFIIPIRYMKDVPPFSIASSDYFNDMAKECNINNSDTKSDSDSETNADGSNENGNAGNNNNNDNDNNNDAYNPYNFEDLDYDDIDYDEVEKVYSVEVTDNWLLIPRDKEAELKKLGMEIMGMSFYA